MLPSRSPAHTLLLEGHEAVLFPAMQAHRPLVLVNSYPGERESVRKALETLSAPDANWLFVTVVNWEHELSPWPAPPVFPGSRGFGGGADSYLSLLLEQILPWAEGNVLGVPAERIIGGYSLAGLFALYSLYQTDAFAGCASMSGSLWYPGFVAYAQSHRLCGVPDKIYLSLGDREARTKHPQLSRVESCTRALASHYISLGIPTTFSLVPGGHHQGTARRCAQGLIEALPG